MARKPARKKTQSNPAAKAKESAKTQFVEDARRMGQTTKEERDRHAAESGRSLPTLMDGIAVQRAPSDPLDTEQRRINVQNTHLSPEMAAQLPPTDCKAVMAHCDSLAVALYAEAQAMCALRGSFLIADARGGDRADGTMAYIARLDDLICQLGQLRDSLATHAYN